MSVRWRLSATGDGSDFSPPSMTELEKKGRDISDVNLCWSDQSKVSSIPDTVQYFLLSKIVIMKEFLIQTLIIRDTLNSAMEPNPGSEF